ncbi:MAG: twin-arginine translocase TatA/TatE family subunit [Anaerolineae bacterium]|jgi:sec-independent protein translocase protein TatB
MNIFSNIGITELIVILLLALLVVGPERLPEMGRNLAKILRDVRKAYENLTQDLGPELQSLQQTTKELRDSVDSVRSIPRDTVQSVVKAADLDDTLSELKDVRDSLDQVGKTMSTAGKAIKDPVGAAVQTARKTVSPSNSDESAESIEAPAAVEGIQAKEMGSEAGAAEDETAVDAAEEQSDE